MSSGVTVSDDGIVTGNTYDKYGSRNPLVRRMMDGFEGALDELLAAADPRSLLDVGCGEGVLVHKWAQRLGEARVVGIDLEERSIQAGWAQRKAPNLEYRVMRAGRADRVENLPFSGNEFDVVTAIEVLEHVPDPEHTLAEMARCRASRCGGCSTWRGAPTGATSATRPATSTTGPSARSRNCFRATGRSPRHARRSPGRCCLSGSRTRTDRASQPGGRDGRTVGSEGRSYGSGARLLSIGIATTGVLTFAYFSIASHVLGEVAAKRVDLLWSVMFVIISVIYRPIEQLLSRTIADRRARGHAQHSVRVPIAIQAGFALTFLIVALALREELVDNVFDHYSALYYVLVVGTLAYAASYFARGWLAGHEYFGLFGGLVLMEALSRLCFVLAVALGIASGQTAVALGIAAAPFVSLVVVPAAFARHSGERHGAPEIEDLDAALAGPGTEGVEEAVAADELSLRRGSGFAFAVSGVMLSEQTLLNAAVLTVDVTSVNVALAGVVFNVLLIARAPLQLFQSIQTSLLPHLTGLEATEGHAAFSRAIRVTVVAIAAFAGVVALGLLAIGPPVMKALFGQSFDYGRVGLALMGLGMGMHLISGALNQAALARNQARTAAMCWLVAAVVFVAWMLMPLVREELLRTEIGYLGATGLLALMLAGVYRRGVPAPQTARAASTIAR